jgi:predicted DNA-binding antitoxin AbrB/MazE fold protein
MMGREGLMTTYCTAVYANGVLRPTVPLALEEGAEVRLLITPRTPAAKQRSPAELLAEIVALPTNGGEPCILHQGSQEGTGPVDKVRVYYDRTGNTLTVWFGDPAKESVCEEIDDDVVLMKDRRGRVIGFERLNYLSRKQQAEGTQVPVEVQVL